VTYPIPQLTGRILAILIALTVVTRAASGQAINIDRAGVAIRGYDPISYFSDSAATKGLAKFAANYEGATYWFATGAHRDMFLTDPAHYVPVYGGFCACGVAQGHKVSIDPEAFRVVDGGFYLNYSKSVQRRWLEDVPGNIMKADKNWTTLRDSD
jgi:YHS domain-containing protein